MHDGSKTLEEITTQIESTEYKEYHSFYDDCKEYAMLAIPGLSPEEFSLIFSFAWEEGHSCGYHEVFNVLQGFMWLVEELYRHHSIRCRQGYVKEDICRRYPDAQEKTGETD
jgi:hypothetical protein